MWKSGFYPSFPTPSFSGMSGSYGSPFHSGVTDSFLFTQGGHPGAALENSHWTNMKGLLPVQDMSQRASVLGEMNRNDVQQPIYGRPVLANGAQWVCPCKGSKENEGPLQSCAGMRQAGSGVNPNLKEKEGTCQSFVGVQPAASNVNPNTVVLQPSEMEQSISRSLADGPLLSDHTTGALESDEVFVTPPTSATVVGRP